MSEVVFSIPDLPPSINRLMRMHWAVKRDKRDTIAMQMIAAIKKVDIRALRAWAEIGDKVSVQMHVTTPKLYDEDNLSSLGKLPLDIMRNLNWLRNDDPAHVRFEKPTQERGPKSIKFTIKRVE